MVYILLADGFEEIEALCPLDLLRRAGVEVKTVSVTDRKTVVGSHGIPVVADYTDGNDLKELEMLILPGGMPGSKTLDTSPFVEGCIRYAAGGDAYIAAICAAPMVLGHRGLLTGKKATCYPGFEPELAGAILTDAPAVRDGRIITGRGMGAAYDFGLLLVETLKGKDAADALGRAIVYYK
ncbi:MAG: DJ-1/PfpI family protein [Clostridia bacterium]|nr:DJ-1/PfpI family protein [Clostridia bacterium]